MKAPMGFEPQKKKNNAQQIDLALFGFSIFNSEKDISKQFQNWQRFLEM